MINQKFLPTKKEIEHFFLCEIEGNMTCYSDLDYDINEMIHNITQFVSDAIEKAINLNETSNPDMLIVHQPEKEAR